MRTYRQQLTITSDSNEQFLNLSFEVEECVRRLHQRGDMRSLLPAHNLGDIP